VELITPHRTTNYHETRKGGQGPVWAVAPLHHHHQGNDTACCPKIFCLDFSIVHSENMDNTGLATDGDLAVLNHEF
jgi:hypothetical protein